MSLTKPQDIKAPVNLLKYALKYLQKHGLNFRGQGVEINQSTYKFDQLLFQLVVQWIDHINYCEQITEAPKLLQKAIFVTSEEESSGFEKKDRRKSRKLDIFVDDWKKGLQDIPFLISQNIIKKLYLSFGSTVYRIKKTYCFSLDFDLAYKQQLNTSLNLLSSSQLEELMGGMRKVLVRSMITSVLRDDETVPTSTIVLTHPTKSFLCLELNETAWEQYQINEIASEELWITYRLQTAYDPRPKSKPSRLSNNRKSRLQQQHQQSNEMMAISNNEPVDIQPQRISSTVYHYEPIHVVSINHEESEVDSNETIEMSSSSSSYWLIFNKGVKNHKTNQL
jgi:hypothetical protein